MTVFVICSLLGGVLGSAAIRKFHRVRRAREAAEINRVAVLWADGIRRQCAVADLQRALSQGAISADEAVRRLRVAFGLPADEHQPADLQEPRAEQAKEATD